MFFGSVPVDAAAGAILAHSVSLSGGARLRKGRVLGAEDIQKLRQAGIAEVDVARLEDGDLHEDRAAAELAAAIAPVPETTHLRIGKAATGRVNLYAMQAGLLHMDADRIHAANRVDPMVTIATLPPYRRVTAGEMVATIKIISYGVPGDAVLRASQNAAHSMAIAAPRLKTARLIETRIAEAVPSIKGRRATETRLKRLGVSLAPREVVAHETAAIAAALESAREDLILILTASATSDSADTAPAALRQVGGEVLRYGMPVDPGNLLFLGALGQAKVIGLPGCARSMAANGADWVMDRVICGLDPDDADIAAMGVGGLLKEAPSRPHPRRGASS